MVEAAEGNDEMDVHAVEEDLERVASQTLSQHRTEPVEPSEPLETLEWQKFCRGWFRTMSLQLEMVQNSLATLDERVEKLERRGVGVGVGGSSLLPPLEKIMTMEDMERNEEELKLLGTAYHNYVSSTS